MPISKPSNLQDSFFLRDIVSPSLFTALALLGVAYVFEHFANVYAFAYSLRPTSNHVGDPHFGHYPRH